MKRFPKPSKIYTKHLLLRKILKNEERFTSPHNLDVKNRLFETIRSTGRFTAAPDNTIHFAMRGRLRTGKKTNSKTTTVKNANRIKARQYSTYICRRRISLSTGLQKSLENCRNIHPEYHLLCRISFFYPQPKRTANWAIILNTTSSKAQKITSKDMLENWRITSST
mgnify:CR=1 FL=1